MNKQTKGMLFLTGAFSLAGTSVISARFVTGKLDTFTITAVSLFFSLICLAPINGREIFKAIKNASLRDWTLIFFQALFGIFMFRMFLLFGLSRTSSVEAGILTGATPAVTAILAALLLKEAMSRNKLIGIISTIAGIMLIQGLFMPGNKFSLAHLTGNILILCASISESSFNIFSRVMVVKNHSSRMQAMSPMVQTALVSGIAFILCIIPASFEHPVLMLSRIGVREWLALIWYGMFVTALAFIFWYAGINRCQASTAAAFSGMMPFTALVLSILILGEPAGAQQWIGGSLVILGMVLIGRSKAKIQ